MPASSTVRFVAPYEMNGSGTPVSGASPSTANTFRHAWLRMSEVIPAASSFAYAPFAAFATRSPA